MGGIGRRLELRWQHNDYESQVQFLLGMRNPDGSRSIVRPVIFEALPEYAVVEEPTFALHKDAARDFLRSVMDAAWEMGIRPTGYDNDLGATKAHLTDMRRIAFHKLGMRDG